MHRLSLTPRIAVCIYLILFQPTLIPWVLYIVGVVTRAISVVADIAVLGFTLWKTIHVWRMDEENRATARLATTLAHNGTVLIFLLLQYSF